MAGAAAVNEVHASTTFRPVQRQLPVSYGIRQLHLVQQDTSIKPQVNVTDHTPYSAKGLG